MKIKNSKENDLFPVSLSFLSVFSIFFITNKTQAVNTSNGMNECIRKYIQMEKYQSEYWITLLQNCMLKIY